MGLTPETSVVVTVFLGWILAVWLHELAHTLAAYWSGNRKALELVWKPHKYVHPITSVLLPLVALFFGGIPLMGGGCPGESRRLGNAPGYHLRAVPLPALLRAHVGPDVENWLSKRSGARRPQCGRVLLSGDALVNAPLVA